MVLYTECCVILIFIHLLNNFIQKFDVDWEPSHFGLINTMDFKPKQLLNIYLISIKKSTTLKFFNYSKGIYVNLKGNIVNGKDKIFYSVIRQFL